MAGRNVGSRSGKNDAARAASAQDGGPPQADAQVNRAAKGPAGGFRVGSRAVVYVRISDDPSGLERGVGRQEADCRALAQDLGLVVVSTFKQRTVTLPSGEKVRRVVRPMFRAMLALLAEGGADVMVAYDLDRAVRDPRDLEDLVDARTLHGFKVRSGAGSLRLDTDSDVAMARVLVAMANKSSADGPPSGEGVSPAGVGGPLAWRGRPVRIQPGGRQPAAVVSRRRGPAEQPPPRMPPPPPSLSARATTGQPPPPPLSARPRSRAAEGTDM
jgi:hypothetical protein